jgi:hypothetical protein
MRPAIQILMSVALLGVAGIGFWYCADGILSGAVQFPSKRESVLVLREVSPRAFWSCVAIWIGVGLGLAWLAVKNFREAIRA